MSARQQPMTVDDAPSFDTLTPVETPATSSPHHLEKPAALAAPIRMTHHPKAGLNPISDAASSLFSLLGKLKKGPMHSSLIKLQKQLIKEMHLFQETLLHHGYSKEYSVVCRYVMCATFDDVISHYHWGHEWHFFLLSFFKQDLEHETKFFLIMDKAINEPDRYIELMELMYLCLTLGYKGCYRNADSEQPLEQVVSHLYKHIRAHRGGFSKKLSPMALKTSPKTVKSFSLITVFFIATCVMMSLFIVLGLLMEIVTNDAYDRIKQIEVPVLNQLAQS